MKLKNKLLLGIIACILTSCYKIDNTVTAQSYEGGFTEIKIYGQQSLLYKVVVIDGNEYFACQTHNGRFVLCPKLPPKENK